jgi:hypothetical protein
LILSNVQFKLRLLLITEVLRRSITYGIAQPHLRASGRCIMSQDPEFRHLEYFVAVAEECSFNAAANRLHVAQPSLSTQIKRLEEIVGATLFMRARETSLTPAGSALLPLARQIPK